MNKPGAHTNETVLPKTSFSGYLKGGSYCLNHSLSKTTAQNTIFHDEVRLNMMIAFVILSYAYMYNVK